MNLKSNKWIGIVVMSVITLEISYFFFFGNSTSQMTKSFGMASMVIKEKHHHIEPGKLEMWVIGYNAYEKEENRERYKIYIEESMVYNLIEEGEEYMVSVSSFREDAEFGYVYQLEQISNQEEYQMAGRGRIK